MKVWTKLSPDELFDVAEEVGVCIADRGTSLNRRNEIRKVGRAYSFGLRPSEYRDESGNHHYQRISASVFTSGRRVHAVCWHGHRDFMRTIFSRDPNARIKTSWADYKGSADFEEKFPDTAYRNVGSQMYPQYASDVCTCGGW